MTSSAVCCRTMNLRLDAGRPPTYALARSAAAATEIPVSDSLQVWLDTDFLAGKLQIGTLTHDCGAIRFAYDPSWLQHPLSFAIDPDLSLGDGAFHPKPDQGNFRVFDDSAPDRWGQMLMKRREALNAKDERQGQTPTRAYSLCVGLSTGRSGPLSSHSLQRRRRQS